eukprot:GHUV01039091.1.p2 GENE.GHUV01039091.1~~GHUV01039091.1.p2  ORF type:complete len:128 (+),score=26.53 GHUV01039091.1:641-1024(+)
MHLYKQQPIRQLLACLLSHTPAESEGRDGGHEPDVDDEFDDDEEAVKGMARLFCEVAEAYIQLVLSAQPDVSEHRLVMAGRDSVSPHEGMGWPPASADMRWRLTARHLSVICMVLVTCGWVYHAVHE